MGILERSMRCTQGVLCLMGSFRLVQLISRNWRTVVFNSWICACLRHVASNMISLDSFFRFQRIIIVLLSLIYRDRFTHNASLIQKLALLVSNTGWHARSLVFSAKVNGVILTVGSFKPKLRMVKMQEFQHNEPLSSLLTLNETST